MASQEIKENHSPLVSIITVCKNAQESIIKTMMSVSSQENIEIEHIFVDGLSKDNTVEMISNYGFKNKRIISESDTGIYSAMNKGMKMATGEWIHFLNAGDEYVDKNTLSSLCLGVDSSDVVAAPIIEVRGKQRKTGIPFFDEKNKHYGFPHQGLFVRRGFYLENGGYDEKYKIISDGLYYSDHFKSAKIRILCEYPVVIMDVGVSGSTSLRSIYEISINIVFKHDFTIQYRIRLFLDYVKHLLRKLIGRI